MADRQIGNIQGVTAAETDATPEEVNLGDVSDADLISLSTMRSRLGAIDGTYYDAARLNQMTANDMMFAIRQNDSSSEIKQ